jgi:hypothetical protein
LRAEAAVATAKKSRRPSFRQGCTVLIGKYCPPPARGYRLIANSGNRFKKEGEKKVLKALDKRKITRKYK